MFTKNSRYAKLPLSSPVNANGERLQGTNLRLNPASNGIFLHTVQSRDRLDLLALKYYNEPTKWWQICDANPRMTFPLALLDRGPIREEVFDLVSPGAETRFSSLITAITLIGAVRNPQMAFSGSSAVVLAVTPVMRTNIINTIQGAGLHYIDSFSWSDGMTSGELFRFEDRTAKQSWRLLMQDLEAMAGVVEAQSYSEDGLLRVVYNDAAVKRERILMRFQLRGYEMVAQESQLIERTGAQIVIPPNGVS